VIPRPRPRHCTSARLIPYQVCPVFKEHCATTQAQHALRQARRAGYHSQDQPSQQCGPRFLRKLAGWRHGPTTVDASMPRPYNAGDGRRDRPKGHDAARAESVPRGTSRCECSSARLCSLRP
jgi:hypothetical protein